MLFGTLHFVKAAENVQKFVGKFEIKSTFDHQADTRVAQLKELLVFIQLELKKELTWNLLLHFGLHRMKALYSLQQYQWIIKKSLECS